MKNKSWCEEKILSLFNISFLELLFQSYKIHRNNFDATKFEFCTLSSIKTGACPENCAYCTQSGHFRTSTKIEKLIDLEQVISQAMKAKENGAKRFCMGAAWRSPPKKDIDKVLEMIKAVKNLGLETCATLGMLSKEQANKLKQAGLDYYNHNIDTSPNYYKKIITTRTYQDRIDTIKNIINADINLCCGGILGMGETKIDIAHFLLELYNLPIHPKSIPINKLIPMKNTPLENSKEIDSFDFVKTIAITRQMFPKSVIRLSGNRKSMSNELQSLCFMAGANSIFIGEKLFTSKNSSYPDDSHLFDSLNISSIDVK
ncbi:MAG: biotin synthase BioB [Legionellales bacterium]|nr:biotin synthase BioB [Legionellales bacterium]